MIYREFYRELGNLLFAVAKADGIINRAEFEKVKALVLEELRNLEDSTDEFGSDLAYFTEFEFEFDDEQVQTATEAYLSFITFVKANQERIGRKLRMLAYSLALRIAETFHSVNRAEVNLLRNLKRDLGLPEPPARKRRTRNLHSNHSR